VLEHYVRWPVSVSVNERHRSFKWTKPTLIEANFGCMGLYRSFLDCGAGVVVSSRSG
jgi:hypothetical protein